MTRRAVLRLALGLGAGLAGVGVGGGGPAAAAELPAGGLIAREPAGPELMWSERVWLGFGTTLRLRAGHENASTLAHALDAAVAAVRGIEAQMSLFDPGSALSHLNREGRLANPPADLLAVLHIARDVSARSDGAFDITVQPLWQAYASAQAEGRLPSAGELEAARARVGWQAVQADAHEIRFARPGMAITLNGIAQGYASDRVREVLLAHGIRHALADTGEFAPAGRNAEHRPWVLGVADPHDEALLLARLQADGRCVATSSDALTTFTPDHRHHHIVDPRTGRSPPGLSQVTVAAAQGAWADALTKVLFMAGPSGAAAMAARFGVDAMWVDKQGHWQATPGLVLTR
jgi:FAD:protein FMN transferase